jgi:DNA primase
LLYKKGDLLYGLDLARESIRTADRTVVVEGYIDVISAHQHGFANVVAPLGTALTKNHIALIKRLSHNVYLALDADAAGQRATLKGLNSLRESVGEDGDGHLVPTAQGVLRLESDVTLRIIRMPEGRDPDEVIRADPDLWRSLIESAVPVMEFYLTMYTAGRDLRDPLQQREALDKLLPLLAELDGTNQRVYIARVEQVIGIRAELILDLLKGQGGRGNQGQGDRGRWDKGTRGQGDRGRWDKETGRQGERGRGERVGKGTGNDRRPSTADPEVRQERTPRAQEWDAPHPADGDAPHPADDPLYGMPAAAPAETAPAKDSPAPRLPPRIRTDEHHLLVLALHYPTVAATLDTLLEQGLAGYPALRPLFGSGMISLFTDPVHQELWRLYSAAPVEQRPIEVESLTTWAELLPEPTRSAALAIITQIARRPHNFRHRSEAEDCAIKLRLAQVKQAQTRLGERARHAEASEIESIAQQLAQLLQYLGSLQKPRRSTTFPDLRDTLGQ